MPRAKGEAHAFIGDLQIKLGCFCNTSPPLNRSAGNGLAQTQFQAHVRHRYARLMERPVCQNATRFYPIPFSPTRDAAVQRSWCVYS